MNNADVLQYLCHFFVCVCLLFQMPKMQFRSNAKPSLYAYPEPLKPPKKEEKEKVWGSSLWGKFFPSTNLTSEWFGDHESETVAW